MELKEAAWNSRFGQAGRIDNGHFMLAIINPRTNQIKVLRHDGAQFSPANLDPNLNDWQPVAPADL